MKTFRHFYWHLVILLKTFFFTVKHIGQEACRSIRPLKDAVNRQNEYAVITGGNRGIGWYAIQGLVVSGMKVIAGCRDGKSKQQLFEKLEKAGISSDAVEWISLDMSSMESIRNFAATILQKNVPISLLINNAGIFFTPFAVTKDGFEQQFAVNYLGHFLLCHLLLPRLIEAGSADKPSRIVSVSSALSSLEWFKIDDLQSKTFYNKWGAYAQSKMAQIMFTETLNGILVSHDYPVKCYSICPGTIRSNWYGNNWYSKLFILFFGFMFKSESEGAQRILYAAFSPELDEFSGAYLQNSYVSKKTSCSALRTKLWDISCQLVEIEHYGRP